MPSLYIPDKWVMLKIESPEHGAYYKVLASWYGGFGGSDSWKLSSSTIKVDENDSIFEFHQATGSIYQCHKSGYGMSMYTQGVLSTWVKQIDGTGNTVTVMPFEEINETTRS